MEDLSYYMEEGCGIYAMAVARQYPDAEIYILSRKHGEEWSESIPYEVTHVYCHVPGVGDFDVKGNRSPAQMAADFDMSTYEVKGPFTPQEFYAQFMGNSDNKPLYGTKKDINAVEVVKTAAGPIGVPAVIWPSATPKKNIKQKPERPTPPVAGAMGLPSWDDYLKQHGGLDGVLSQFSYTGEAWELLQEYNIDCENLTDEQMETEALALLKKCYAYWMASYKKLKWPLTVYRQIRADEPNLDDVGIYWSLDSDNDLEVWKPSDEKGTMKEYDLEARIPSAASVDWMGTIGANLDPVIGEREHEIRLKPGAPLELVSVQEWASGEAKALLQKPKQVVAASNKNAQRVFVAGMHPELRGEECEIALKPGTPIDLLAYKPKYGNGWLPLPEQMAQVTKTAGYTAYVLTNAARDLVLKSFPPRFPDVIAHHVTFQFGGKEVPPPATIVVEGYCSDDSLEALVVSVNGTTTRPDGEIYHITLSLDRSQGRAPKDSKAVVAAGWNPIEQPFDVQVIPQKIAHKTATEAEPGLIYRSSGVEEKNHDYQPSWDYEIDEQPNPELAKIAAQCAQSEYAALKAKGIIDDWMFGFEVWAVDLSAHNAVGMYINGTYDFPVILIDLNAHVGYEDQIGKTINHELKHAVQESKEEDFDEDDAESDEEFKTASRDRNKWTMGGCFSFARAFKKKFGGEYVGQWHIYGVIDGEEQNAVVHVGVLKDGFVYDGSGKNTEEGFKNNFKQFDTDEYDKDEYIKESDPKWTEVLNKAIEQGGFRHEFYEDEVESVLPKTAMKSTVVSPDIILYRGEGPGTTRNGRFWSPDANFAKQFTRQGLESELLIARIPKSEIYKATNLPYGGDFDLIDAVVEVARAKSYSAVWCDEGKGEPNSVYVFDPSHLHWVRRRKYAAPVGFDINNVKIKRGDREYSNTWFAYWRGKKIGWASLGQFGEDELAKDERCIWKSNVLEDYRRSGVATKLYDAVEEFCKVQGWKLVASPPRVLSDDAFGFWKHRSPETLKSDSRTWNAPYIGKELEYKGNKVRLTSLSDKGGVAEFLVPQKSTTSWGEETTSTTTWVPASVVFEQLGAPKTASSKKVRAYHGTTKQFDIFDTPAMFHIRRKYCEDLIAGQPDGHVMEAILTIKNPADLDALHISPSDPNFKEIAKKLEAEGYDGAQYKNEAWIAFSPEQIEVIRPKTAILHTKEDAASLISELESKGLHTELIGGVAEQGSSLHDIDLIVTQPANKRSIIDAFVQLGWAFFGNSMLDPEQAATPEDGKKYYQGWSEILFFRKHGQGLSEYKVDVWIPEPMQKLSAEVMEMEPEIARDEPAVEEPQKEQQVPTSPPPEQNKLVPAQQEKLVTKPKAPPKKREPKPKPYVPPTENKSFQRWFGRSKVIDGAGNPLVVYHGTTHDFDTFQPDFGNPENFYGVGYYFTSSQTDTENYAGVGPDLTSRIDHEAENLVSEWDSNDEIDYGVVPPDWVIGGWEDLDDDQKREAYQDMDWDVKLEIARAEVKKKLVGEHGGAVMPCYLRIVKPVIVARRGGTYFNVGSDRNGDYTGKLFEAVERTMMYTGVDPYKFWSEVAEGAYDGFTAYEFEQAARRSESMMDDDILNEGGPGPIIANIYRHMGFDGIIMENPADEFSNMHMERDTRHYIVWQSNQIKSASGNTGKYDKKNPSITAAKQIKTVDEIPNLKESEKELCSKTRPASDFGTYYHGTSSIFLEMIQQQGLKAGSYVSLDEDYALYEAKNTVNGEEGHKATGGDPVVIIIDGSKLNGVMRPDPENLSNATANYEGDELWDAICEWVVEQPIPASAVVDFETESPKYAKVAGRWEDILEKQRAIEGLRAAIRDPETGKVYTGQSHMSAIESTPAYGSPNFEEGLYGRLYNEWDNATDNVGFIDRAGRFITRREAEANWGITTMEDRRDALKRGAVKYKGPYAFYIEVPESARDHFWEEPKVPKVEDK
jgi:hypothetical protein